MKPCAALFFVLALILCNCCPEAGSWQEKVLDKINEAGHAVSESMLGPFAGPAPSQAPTSDDDCHSVPQPSPPVAEPAAVSMQQDVCAKSSPEDKPCSICMKASCCAESFACLADLTCTCHMAAVLGIAWPKEAPCDDPNPAFAAASACLDDHCAEECVP